MGAPTQSQDLKKMLRRRVIFVPGIMPMVDVVSQMREFNISCVLVLDENNEVSGIITERDIVQKFTLLEMKNKLDAKALTFMTRPVIMARLDYLDQDVRDYFLRHKIRHFPVSSGANQVEDIVGIITVTDLAGAWLNAKLSSNIQPSNEFIVIIVAVEKSRMVYSKLLKALSFTPINDGEGANLIKKAVTHALPVVLDLDGVDLVDAKRYLTQLKNHKQPVVLLSSQEEIVIPLRKILKDANFHVVLKPLEVSHIVDLLGSVRREIQDFQNINVRASKNQ